SKTACSLVLTIEEGEGSSGTCAKRIARKGQSGQYVVTILRRCPVMPVAIPPLVLFERAGRPTLPCIQRRYGDCSREHIGTDFLCSKPYRLGSSQGQDSRLLRSAELGCHQQRFDNWIPSRWQYL